ncbi:MAG: hypothetical protein ACJ0GD_02990 [Candidatus Actinomarina sp.]|jgi:hypothetical protein|nr:hypothetical protein [Candidatus Actinomarina sp.]NND23733.1 hypothetical protein [Acidimicrobiia bacterium]OUX06065.1 MAG: hypothetical protein CBE04_02605 [Acidimicrobiaceae bacterium TMED244]|tara:strand:+ start:4776 stop:5147 length:372 start_codon:yes stop_codon:yes gene_type:complete
MINNFHGVWAIISIWTAGISGVVLIAIYISRSAKYEKIGTYLINLSISTILIQTAGGLILYSQKIDPGSFHLFYGVVVLFTLTFLYVYRSEMNKNYYLYWGLALLFLMGLEIRAIMTLGRILD